jgi:NADPH:quinone reductase-like Zn-dependent oxidoreductase
MRRLLRIAFQTFLLLVPLALGTLALVLSHDSACGAAPPLAAGATPMRAIAYRCYGSPDVLKLELLAKPVPADGQVLVKVHAASANPLDWHFMRGTPYLMRFDAGIGRPKGVQLGVDFSGTVETVGKDVTRFRPGDAVFGGRTGAFAEYVVLDADRALAHKPANVGFAQAAAVPIAATTALQALRDDGRLQPGQKVLINGASGGVGTFAVQIAKALGAEVTGVCSGRNVELVRSLGADHVIDYTQRNFTEGEHRYDLIVDMVGSQGLLDMRRVLTPQGRLVIVGGPDGKWLGPLAAPLKAIALSPFVEQEMGMMLAELKQTDLVLLAEWMQAGKVRPVIDRSYPLEQVPEAIRYLEEGRARGKVVIQVVPEADAGSGVALAR